MTYIYNTKFIASGSLDSTIKLWNYETGDCFKVLEVENSILLSLIHISGTNFLIGSCSGNAVRLWNYESGECIKTLKGNTN